MKIQLDIIYEIRAQISIKSAIYYLTFGKKKCTQILTTAIISLLVVYVSHKNIIAFILFSFWKLHFISLFMWFCMIAHFLSRLLFLVLLTLNFHIIQILCMMRNYYTRTRALSRSSWHVFQPKNSFSGHFQIFGHFFRVNKFLDALCIIAQLQHCMFDKKGSDEFLIEVKTWNYVESRKDLIVIKEARL